MSSSKRHTPLRRRQSSVRALRADERGFTLTELLVVILIVGLLAAIAVPAFYEQRDKAHDAGAKESVRAAANAIEAFAADHGGSYQGADEGDLRQIEGTLGDVPLTVDSATERTYELRVTSKTGNEFTLAREASGETNATCTESGDRGCPEGGIWG